MYITGLTILDTDNENKFNTTQEELDAKIRLLKAKLKIMAKIQ
ncbi:7336_t:CDS:1, partial [Cetraspora pellucida]